MGNCSRTNMEMLGDFVIPVPDIRGTHSNDGDAMTLFCGEDGEYWNLSMTRRSYA